MTKKINGCPYKASNSGQCTHKEHNLNGKGRIYCSQNNPDKCDLYRKWLSKLKKSKIKGGIPLKRYKENAHD